MSRGREAFFEGDDSPIPVPYSHYAPQTTTLANGNVVINNLYTRVTGESPIILPGMTPTTVDAPIVAAGANAGFTSELAGGGQVTEAIFRTRVEELKELLNPAQKSFSTVSFWTVSLGFALPKSGLVVKLKRGSSDQNVTVSAGIPEVGRPVRSSLNGAAHLHNAFKREMLPR